MFECFSCPKIVAVTRLFGDECKLQDGEEQTPVAVEFWQMSMDEVLKFCDGKQKGVPFLVCAPISADIQKGDRIRLLQGNECYPAGMEINLAKCIIYEDCDGCMGSYKLFEGYKVNCNEQW